MTRVGKRPRRHLQADCADIWACGKLHHLMTAEAEDSLQRYPGEWVLLDRHTGVKFHSSAHGPIAVMQELARSALGEKAHDLILHKVPQPGVAHFYGIRDVQAMEVSLVRTDAAPGAMDEYGAWGFLRDARR